MLFRVYVYRLIFAQLIHTDIFDFFFCLTIFTAYISKPGHYSTLNMWSICWNWRRKTVALLYYKYKRSFFWFQEYYKYYAVNKWLIFASDNALFTKEYVIRLLGSRHMPLLMLLAVCQQRRVRNALIKRRCMSENLRKRTLQDPPLILICLTSSSRRGPINNKGAFSGPAFMKRKPVHHNGSN